jgi:(p)ppGpp synthase/HD superfamily hydrolase
MKILCQNNCNDETISAGILHDVVEDTETTIEQVENIFGKRVAEIVATASEKLKLDKKNFDELKSWKERKIETIKHIEEQNDEDCLMVIAADKLDNISAIYEDYQTIGDELWKRFNAPKEEQKWYYFSIIEILDKKADKFEKIKPLTKKIQNILKEVFE